MRGKIVDSDREWPFARACVGVGVQNQDQDQNQNQKQCSIPESD